MKCILTTLTASNVVKQQLLPFVPAMDGFGLGALEKGAALLRYHVGINASRLQAI
jgi:hypothetical protein